MEKEMQQLQQRGRQTPSSASYKTISSTSGRGSGMRSPSNVTSSTRISTKRSSDSISRTPTSRHRSHHYNDRRRHRKRASVDQSGRGEKRNDAEESLTRGNSAHSSERFSDSGRMNKPSSAKNDSAATGQELQKSTRMHSDGAVSRQVK
ncbi:unnamed protein product [Toxocara canis]|uniref:Ovule protein n=1 Tax=Toxocara canis TaxID=6265 RepID=A0A183U6W9_TOXCA|nr:unnamed protein product [Toxocara canis]